MGRDNGSERGQALVLIILAIVGIMGFAALAVDFGRVYSERRRAQNAADTGALAAAYAAARDEDFYAAAEAVINENDYIVSAGEVDINHPPVPPSPYANNTNYYQVVIHQNVAPIFSQFVYRGPMEFTVEATAHAVKAHGIADGLALVALSPDVCPGLTFNGNIEVNIRGGGIFSNSVGTTAHNCSSGIVTGASGFIHVDGGSIQTAGEWIQNAGFDIQPTPIPRVDTRNFELPPIPNCSKHATQTVSGTNLQSGNYYPPSAHPNWPAMDLTGGAYNLAPGLYCLHGDLEMNTGTLRGTGITIVMYEGGVYLNGGADIKISAPAQIFDDKSQPDQYNGMLIYMPMGNKMGIDIGGNTGSTYTGSIYAPDIRTDGKLNSDGSQKPKCNIGGTTDSIVVNSSVMCYNIGISGDTTFNFNYDDTMNYKFKPTIDLVQ